MIFFSTLLISMFVTIALIPTLRVYAMKVNCVDIPCDRKVHDVPMPKVGGFAMALGMLLPILLWSEGGRFGQSVLIGIGVIVLFGAIDDFKDLNCAVKFAGQLLAALVVVFYGGLEIKNLSGSLSGGIVLPSYISVPLTVITIIGVTNAINLSDGLDGLAGGISLMIILCIWYLAFSSIHIATHFFISVVAIAVIGSIFGFLRFNTYPAEVFMGDAGSQLLGFLTITLSIGLTQGDSPYSPFLPFLLLGFPILDTLTVMTERIARGVSPFKADKNHFHHKLMRMGLYHTEAVTVVYVLQAFLVASAFLLRFYRDWLLLLIYAIFSVAVFGFFAWAGKTEWKLQRFDWVDRVVKGRLRELKQRDVLIKFVFHALEFGIPFILIAACLMPAVVPVYFSVMCMALALLIVICWIAAPRWLTSALRLVVYLTVPMLIYLGRGATAVSMSEQTARLYAISFLALAFFVVLTLKLTRRKKGFMATPMDVLILIIAFVGPNLPDEQIINLNIGAIAAQIIVFLFSFEVLLGELRGRFTRLSVALVLSLTLVGIRGFM